MKNDYNRINKPSQKSFCIAYQSDYDQAYAFYCSRYENISYEEFGKLGMYEFLKKLNSIPQNEPLFEIIKSRIIDTSTIKNKDERQYWNKLKEINKIPEIYYSRNELNENLKKEMKNIEDGKSFGR